jgi:ribonuclease Z
VLSVTFLGTSAARPTVERNVSSLAVHREGETLLFDCGEGTQRQMMRFGVSFALVDVFFTHFHADHFLGIIGLLRTLGLQGRVEPMRFFGPPGAKQILSAAASLGVERVPFELEIHELRPGDCLQRGEYDLVAFETEHARHSLGFALVEHDRLGRFDPDRARALGIPEGPLWGKLHRGETVRLDDGREVRSDDLVGPARPGRKLVYTGDTRPCQSVVHAADGADLLIHEATFDEEERDRAHETGHSTAVQAAQVALAARVNRLALVHLSARYSRDTRGLLDEAQSVFPETVVAKDGMEIDVPFPDAEPTTALPP